MVWKIAAHATPPQSGSRERRMLVSNYLSALIVIHLSIRRVLEYMCVRRVREDQIRLDGGTGAPRTTVNR